MNLVSLDKDYSIKLKSKVENYLNPNLIYIPIYKNKVTFKKNDYIKKETEIFKNVYSPISGKIIGIKRCLLWNKTIEKCLVIANDFQEKLGARKAVRKKINDLTKADVIKDIKDFELDKLFLNSNIKHLVICGIDDEPYIANEVFTQKENTKTILETIDFLLNVYPESIAHIVIKNIDSENIDSYNNFLGTYKNIELCLVDDLYLIGKETNLLERLNIKEDYLFLKASDLFKIYNNIKKRKINSEKYITITGDAIKTPRMFNIKIGTKIMDIIKKYYELNPDKYDIYVNGLMQGDLIDIKELIVTKELDGLLIMKKTKHKKRSCIKCGKCLEICPIKSNPLLAYEKKVKVKCINCGLCTYICPVYINLKAYLKGDKDE